MFFSSVNVCVLLTLDCMVIFLAAPFSNQVVQGKSFNFSKTQFDHLQNRAKN